MIKIIKFITVLLILVCPATCTSIGIYYPDNNTTTDINMGDYLVYAFVFIGILLVVLVIRIIIDVIYMR